MKHDIKGADHDSERGVIGRGLLVIVVVQAFVVAGGIILGQL